MALILAGEVSDAQAGAFPIAMRMKGEAPEEPAGIAQALRDAVSLVAAAAGSRGTRTGPRPMP